MFFCQKKCNFVNQIKPKPNIVNRLKRLQLPAMEQLLHYCWKYKMLPLSDLRTTDGREVEVIDPGLHNHHAGPDFFNAKVKIAGTLWVGTV